MIRADQIPPEAVEAAARVLCIAYGYDPDRLVYSPVASGEKPKLVERWCTYIETARASIAAALSAWPNATTTSWFENSTRKAVLNIPLAAGAAR